MLYPLSSFGLCKTPICQLIWVNLSPSTNLNESYGYISPNLVRRQILPEVFLSYVSDQSDRFWTHGKIVTQVCHSARSLLPISLVSLLYFFLSDFEGKIGILEYTRDIGFSLFRGNVNRILLRHVEFLWLFMNFVLKLVKNSLLELYYWDII